MRQLLDRRDPKIANSASKIAATTLHISKRSHCWLRNAGVIKPDVAFYMFSWEAIQCWAGKQFWDRFDKGDRYWGLLRTFVEEMASMARDFEVDPKSFKF